MSRHVLAVTLTTAIFGSLSSAEWLAAEPSLPRSRAEVEDVLARAPKPSSTEEFHTLNILLLADVKDHGPGEHDYPLWQEQWQTLLATHASKVEVATARRWPTKQQLAKADLLVMYCYPGTPKGRTFSHSQIEQLEAFISGGGGYVQVHSATYTVCDLAQGDGKKLCSVAGVMFGKSMHWRHGPVELKIVDALHPICLGLPETMRFVDEPYWPPTGDLGTVQVLATSDESVPPGAGRKTPQPQLWTHTYGKGRVVGCALGHYSTTFDDPYFRILLLRSMAWAAGECPFRFDPLVLVKSLPHGPREDIRPNAVE